MSTVAARSGIYSSTTLPKADFSRLWESIIIDQEIKDCLLSHAVLNFTLRTKVSRASVPMHGIILLVGPPGTGKTSLGKGLASRTAEALFQTSGMAYVEVEPHGLASSSLGKSQKAVTELFAGPIAEQAMAGPTFVLLDEVETIIGDRSKMSMEANPIDVHRATDAALVQLDHLAEKYPNLLIVATSNFRKAIDEAFISRCDLVLEVPLPNETACLEILRDTLSALATSYPKIQGLVNSPELKAIAKLCVGLDGRQLRKLIVSACSFDKHVALDPNGLKLADIRRAADHAKRRKK